MVRNMSLPIGKLRFVIFDWDNTLAESKTPLLYALNKVIEEKNLPSLEELEKKRNHRLSFKENFSNFFGERAEEVYQRYAEVYLANVADLISTFDYVNEVLAFFLAHRVKIMIMSNKDRCLLDYELPLLFNPDIFEKVVCGQEALRDKPFPEHLFHTLEGYLLREEISPEVVWMVGDSPQDSGCAIASNALPIRIGKDIWNCESECLEKIRYFDDFKHFYQALKSKN